MATNLVDLDEGLKTIAEEILEKSSTLALILERDYQGDDSDEVKKYALQTQIYADGFREVLNAEQHVPSSDAEVRSFASKLDGHLIMTKVSTEKLFEVSSFIPEAERIAHVLSDKREWAQQLVLSLYKMADGQASASRTRGQSVASQLSLNPLFWLINGGASNESVRLSLKLLKHPLDHSTDQEELVNLTVEILLQDWVNGIASVKGLAEEAEEEEDQNKISAAFSLLVYTRNQLRTLYNNLAITVQRLEQRAFV